MLTVSTVLTVSAVLTVSTVLQSVTACDVAVGYGLLGRDFLHLSGPALGPTQRPLQCVRRLFPGVKRAGRGVDHRPPSSVELKKEYSYTSTPPLSLHGML